eukprot:TRINITY_DN6567_c0_g1_i1.p1 TRINITY_DN6567_c0_g1~~TRINITY_DN6567_c0_g1_i1.p1  ORF type:complete len:511 (-),score=116.46 TRINITY_DN6567_c0_g1_i1:2-1534(-)
MTYALSLFESLPLEMIGAIADFTCMTHDYRDLGNLMFVSRRLRDGVSISKRMRIVNEVMAAVQQTATRRKMLVDRDECLLQACVLGRRRLLMFMPELTIDEALSLLPVACAYGHLPCVEFLTSSFDLNAHSLRATSDRLRMQHPLALLARHHIEQMNSIDTGSPFSNEFMCAQIDRTHGLLSPRGALDLAVYLGHLDIVQHFYTVVGLKLGHNRYHDHNHHSHNDVDDQHDHDIINEVCSRGHLHILRYLCESTSGVPRPSCIRTSQALACASAGGNLAVVRFLRTYAYNYDDDYDYNHDINSNHENDAGIIGDDDDDNDDEGDDHMAANAPHTHVSYRVDGIDFDTLEYQTPVYEACRVAPVRVGAVRTIELLRFLLFEFGGLCADDYLSTRPHDIPRLWWLVDVGGDEEVCEEAAVEVGKFLLEEFQLTTADARAENNKALRTAAIGGHLLVVKWLVTTFCLNAEDVMTNDGEVMRRCCDVKGLVEALGECGVVLERIDIVSAQYRDW